MEVIIVGGAGLHFSEVKAIHRMQKEFQNSWHAYAGLVIAHSQGSMEIDCLIITHDRLLLVELKEWNGSITTQGGKWIQNGVNRGTSPYLIKREQAQKLKSLLRQELEHRLGYFLHVEAHVVLCGTATPENIPLTERPYVHTLDEFLELRNAKHYDSIVQSGPLSQYFTDSGKPRPNSTLSLPIISEFFDGPKVKAKELNVGSFAAQRKTPWFKHRHGIYNEFKALDNDNRSALIRRWDFSQLGTLHALQSTWVEIALRESRIGRFVRDHHLLRDYLLHSIHDLSEEDVTEDVCELYELRRTYHRLDDIINSEAKSWDKTTRIDRVRALLAPFADLHGLKIAHRDIDSHNIWYAEDLQSMLVSGFGAAFFPEKGTISDHRRLLQSSPLSLPEDVMSESGELIDPFRIDVFMLGILAYQLCFGQDTLPLTDDVPEWRVPDSDPFEGALNKWFEKALSWDPMERFFAADDMLIAFNVATADTQALHDDAQKVFNQLMHSPYVRQDLNPFVMLNAFPPQPSRAHEALAALGTLDSKKKYYAEKDGKLLLIKLWTNIAISKEHPGTNRRVLQFMQRIERLRESALPTPAVVEFGIMAQNGLFIATEYIPGLTWAEYLEQYTLSEEEKRVLAISLLSTMIDFHEKQISHGDLHVDNVLLTNVTDSESKQHLFLLDLLDFGSESPAFNTRYGPSNPAVTDAFGRDRFATFLMVEELFGDELPSAVADEMRHARENNEFEIPIALEPLLQALQPSQLLSSDLDVNSAPSPSSDTLVIHWNSRAFPNEVAKVEPTEDGYYFNCRWHKQFNDQLQCFITGSNAWLQINLDLDKRKIISIRYQNDIPLSDVVSASRRASTTITQKISIQHGSLSYDHPLLELLMGLEPVIDMMVERYGGSDDETSPLTDEDRLYLSPEHLWKALAETEGGIRQSVIIESADYKYADNSDLIYPYSCVDGNDILIDGDDPLLVYLPNKDAPIGEINLQETTASFLVFRPNFDVTKQIQLGTRLQIESARNKSSRELRYRALQRIISQKATIPNLSCYFDPRQIAPISIMEEKPSIDVLRALYDAPGQETNAKQLQAFQQLVEIGPVGVLQGPPGTGKTTFVSKFIHYLYSHCGVDNILLVGQQHSAVDNVAIKAQELCSDKGFSLDTVRIGREQMIDTRMLAVHSRSLQQKIRHKFHREYDLRIGALSNSLLLPTPLVQAVTQLHRNLAPLLMVHAQYDREREQLVRTGAASESNTTKLEILAQKRGALWEKIDTVVRSQLDEALGELPQDRDLLMSKLMDILAIRYGINNPDKLQRLLTLLNLSQEWLDVLQSGESGYERFMLKTKQLVCGTLVGVGKRSLELDKTTFDWVIVDEAGRAQASELMVAIQCAKRVLLVGDHKQLPPFYHREHLRLACKKLELNPEIFDESDFERAYKACNGVTLDTQYRMIEPIGNLVSACFYADDIGKLHTGRGASPDWYNGLSSPWNKGVTWIDSTTLSGEKQISKGRYINPQEIALLIQLLRNLVEGDVVNHLRQTVTNEQPHPIGIITMYRAQKDEIETHLSRAEWMRPLRDLIRVDTVDSYQGRENKIIILSLVRDNTSSQQGFLCDGPRINVAISRAQERLMVIGASHMWSQTNQNSALGRVFEYITSQVEQSPEHYQYLAGEQILGEQTE
ncbi:serine/threonine protein kinase [Yersinia rohdei]|uniref:AAA domain-containing protein n=1 Tax=Yersinia rohdei TaxID=29485 RepID=UPI0005DC5E97|nr:AAA domain-containing protein [Yersinia rohdei]CNI68378.1 serine/threonine protein kinase [Yersinia rohdei]